VARKQIRTTLVNTHNLVYIDDMKTLDEIIEEEAAKQAAETDAWLEKNKERLAAKAAAERARHIALGWLQEDGSLPEEGEEEDADDEADDDSEG